MREIGIYGETTVVFRDGTTKTFSLSKTSTIYVNEDEVLYVEMGYPDKKVTGNTLGEAKG